MTDLAPPPDASPLDAPRINIPRPEAVADIARFDPFPDLASLPHLSYLGPDEQRAEEVRARGYEDGRTAGMAQGLFEGRARGEAEARLACQGQILATLGSLESAAMTARSDDALVAASLADSLVHVALQLAEAIVGYEVSVSNSPGRDAIRRALAMAPDTGPLVARLHPADVAMLDAAELAEGRDIQVLADMSVPRGGCLLRTSVGMIDALLSTAVDRVRDALISGTDPEHADADAPLDSDTFGDVAFGDGAFNPDGMAS